MRHANALGTSAAGTTIASGAALYFAQPTGDATIAEPLTLSGTGLSSYLPALSVNLAYNQSAQPVVPYPQTTFSGAITLGSNINVGANFRNAKITGAITGNYTITLTDPSSGSVEIASTANGSATSNQTLSPPVKTTTYAENEPSTSITVNTNETAVVTGTYGTVTVYPGGILKGTGTVGTTTVYGKVSPGLSPGCLSTGDLMFFDTGTYDFEIGGTTACTQYDQIKVTGAVTLDGTLTPILFESYKPKVGEKYVIISNDGADAVSGTFNDVAEGGTVTANGYSYKVSYVGGDGNDVELTVLAAAPATGFTLFKSNPIVTAAVIIMAAFGILLIARRSGKMFSRR